MAEQQTAEQAETSAESASAGTSQGTETQTGADEHAIPKHRFDQVNYQLRQAKEQLKELDALKAKLKEHEDAKLSETEKLQSRITELEAQSQSWATERRALAAQQALLGAAMKAGALYPDLLAGQLTARVEFDAQGQPTNVETLVSDAKKAYPAVFRTANGSADGGAQSAAKASGTQDMNALIRRYAGRG